MATHKLDGKWRYSEIDYKNFPPNLPSPESEMIFNIPDDQNGKLEAGSKHKHDLTGNASKDGKKIKIKEKSASGDTEIDYEGHMVFESDAYIIIAGTYKDNSPEAPKRQKKDGQDDGTWVIVKP